MGAKTGQDGYVVEGLAAKGKHLRDLLYVATAWARDYADWLQNLPTGRFSEAEEYVLYSAVRQTILDAGLSPDLTNVYVSSAGLFCINNFPDPAETERAPTSALVFSLIATHRDLDWMVVMIVSERGGAVSTFSKKPSSKKIPVQVEKLKAQLALLANNPAGEG